MKRSPLRRRTPLRSRANGIGVPERWAGTGALARSDLGLPDDTITVDVQRQGRRTFRVQRSFTPASREQRAKAQSGCRIHGGACGNADPMHVTPRGRGGCDDPLCVIPACREVHRLYDADRFDVTPFLTHDEAAHAVGHLGLFGALRRLTNRRWAPEVSDE